MTGTSSDRILLNLYPRKILWKEFIESKIYSLKLLLCQCCYFKRNLSIKFQENSQESRPRIESKLGMESEGEDDQRDLSGLQFSEPLLGASAGAQANTSDNATRSRSPDMENSLMPRGLRVPMQEVCHEKEGVSRGLRVPMQEVCQGREGVHCPE